MSQRRHFATCWAIVALVLFSYTARAEVEIIPLYDPSGKTVVAPEDLNDLPKFDQKVTCEGICPAEPIESGLPHDLVNQPNYPKQTIKREPGKDEDTDHYSGKAGMVCTKEGSLFYSDTATADAEYPFADECPGEQDPKSGCLQADLSLGSSTDGASPRGTGVPDLGKLDDLLDSKSGGADDSGTGKRRRYLYELSAEERAKQLGRLQLRADVRGAEGGVPATTDLIRYRPFVRADRLDAVLPEEVQARRYRRTEKYMVVNGTQMVVAVTNILPMDAILQKPVPARQVKTKVSFADVVSNSDASVSVKFYEPGAVEPELDTNGLYRVKAGHSPRQTWSVENPGGKTDTKRLRITKLKGSASNTWESVWSAAGDTTTMLLTYGAGEKIIEQTTTTNAFRREEIKLTRDNSGVVGSRVRRLYTNMPWGEVLLESRKGAPGAEQSERYEYQADTNAAGGGQVSALFRSDGSWERYHYDEQGQKTKVISGWLDQESGAAESEARVIEYAYGEGNALGVPCQAIEKIGGQEVARTYRRITANPGGEMVITVERCAVPGAAYGDQANIRIQRTYYAPTPEGEQAAANDGRLKSETHSDGRKITHSYEQGDCANPANGTKPESVGFMGSSTGLYLRTTSLIETVAGPVEGKSTKVVAVFDAEGRELYAESYIWGGGSYWRFAWTVRNLNAEGQVTRILKSDGSQVDQTWDCCGLEYQKDENGIEYSYTYDALKRLTRKVKHGIGDQPDQITTYTYDAEGRVLTEVVSAGSLSQSRADQYDLVGRITNSTDFAGLRTITSYSQDGLTTTEILPGGFTRITERFKDGQIKSVTGTAQIPQFHEYGVNADGTRWTKVYSAANGGPVWVKTTTDLLGRPVKVEKPGFSTTEITENFYNSKGQLVKQSTVNGPQSTVALYAYDELGNRIRSGLDVDGNGSLDLAGMDRISETETSYIPLVFGYEWNFDWLRQTVNKIYGADNSAEVITNSITLEQLTSLIGGTRSVVSVLDPFGNETITTTTVDRDAKRVTQTTDVPDSSANIVSISVNGLVQSQTSKSGITTTFAYDSLGRRTRSETVGGTRSVASTSHYDSRGWVDYTEDAAGHRTTFTYDSATGRQLSKTDPLSNTTYFSYTSYGKEEKIWGLAVNPVSYEYDAYNRMVKMHTYRSGTGFSGPAWPADAGSGDVTEWIYHEASGLLTAKKDAAGKSVSYTYDSANRLASRTWARKVDADLRAAYSYNSAGDLIGIDYSDGTPDVSFTYDRLGRQKTASSSVSTHTFAYNGLLLASETIVSSAGTNVIGRSYDSLGRSVATALRAVSSPDHEYSVSYGYDGFGRLNQVSNFQFQASYSYLPNSDLLSGYTIPISNFQFQVSRTYEQNRNLLTQIKNEVNASLISQFDYANDAGGRRTSIKYSGSAFETGVSFNKYDYNNRSEVIVGDKFWGTDINDTGDPVAGQGFAYAYDNIGNRTTSSRDNEEMIYTANNLNQYLQRIVPGSFDLLGSASTGTTVTVSVNGGDPEPVNRHNTYWHKLLRVDNTGVAAYPEVEIVGVVNPPNSEIGPAVTNEPDIVAAETGRVFVAKTPEQFTYDADGNQLQDGRFNYSWDCENRLIGVETREGALPGNVPRIKVEMQYDYLGRRVGKQVWEMRGQWSLLSSQVMLYDSWNLIREETTASGTGKIVDEYIWGLDLSGTLQGAGGIGGLLCRQRRVERYYDGQGKLIICHHPPRNPEQSKTMRINENIWPLHEAHGDTLGACEGPDVTNSVFFYTYDGNGNVSELLQSTANGPQPATPSAWSSVVGPPSSVVAHYEYSPFGELIVSSGPEAADNPFRFSTKYWDSESGLYYYVLRYYSPSLGRWLSRDPIEERGGRNLYVFVGNQPTIAVDPFGDWPWEGCCSGTKYNRFKNCCCQSDGTTCVNGSGDILAKKKQGTGVRRCCEWGRIIGGRDYPKHCWIEFPGGSAGYWPGSNVLSPDPYPDPGRGPTPDPKKTKCDPEETLSPCDYDLKKFMACIHKAAGGDHGLPDYSVPSGSNLGCEWLGAYDCRHWSRDITEKCKKESKGCGAN